MIAEGTTSVNEAKDAEKPDSEQTPRATTCYRDSRTRIQRLLNYKRYIDWLIEKELENVDRQRNA